MIWIRRKGDQPSLPQARWDYVGKGIDLPNRGPGIEPFCGRPRETLRLDSILHVSSCHIDGQSYDNSIETYSAIFP